MTKTYSKLIGKKNKSSKTKTHVTIVINKGQFVALHSSNENLTYSLLDHDNMENGDLEQCKNDFQPDLVIDKFTQKDYIEQILNDYK